MVGFTTTGTLSEMINKFRYKKRKRKSGKKKEKEEKHLKAIIICLMVN